MTVAETPVGEQTAARKKKAKVPPSAEQRARAAEYTLLRKERGTKEEVAQALEVNRSTLVRRESGEIEIPQEAFMALQTLPPREGGPSER